MSRPDIQHMPPEGGNFCDGCGRLVKFKLRTSKPSKAFPGKRIAYLYCPLCGHKATQLRFPRERGKNAAQHFHPAKKEANTARR